MQISTTAASFRVGVLLTTLVCNLAQGQAPRTLIAGAVQQAVSAELPPPPVEVLGIGDSFVLSDPSNRIELYRLQGSLHADDMLIAYLPAINTVGALEQRGILDAGIHGIDGV